MNKILALLATGLLLSACATGPKVRSNTAPGANMLSYKTYTFPAKLGTDRGDVQTPLTGYFKEAVRREMDARGYQFVESGDADLWVNFHVNAKDQTDIRSSPSMNYGVGYYGYRGGMYGGYGGGTDVTTVHYKVGTANIDVVDARKRELVWEGIAEARLTDKMMKDPRTAISNVIAEMFLQYPGKAGT